MATIGTKILRGTWTTVLGAWIWLLFYLDHLFIIFDNLWSSLYFGLLLIVKMVKFLDTDSFWASMHLDVIFLRRLLSFYLWNRGGLQLRFFIISATIGTFTGLDRYTETAPKSLFTLNLDHLGMVGRSTWYEGLATHIIIIILLCVVRCVCALKFYWKSTASYLRFNTSWQCHLLLESLISYMSHLFEFCIWKCEHAS